MAKKYFFNLSDQASIFLYCFVCSTLFVSLAQAAERVELTHLSGEAEVLLKDAEGYAAAEEGMTLESGDKIKTAGEASLELSFNEDDSNVARLGNSTNVEISLCGDEKMVLTEGEVFSSVSQLSSGSAFEIRTPTAVSGARGTDWVTRVSEEGTDVEAIDQSPYVKHFEKEGVVSQQETFIRPGEMTTVKKFQRPFAMRPIMDARLLEWKAVKKDLQRNIGEAKIKRQQRPAFNRPQFLQKIKEQRGGFRMKKPDAFGPGGDVMDFGKKKPMAKPGEEKGRDIKSGPARRFLPGGWKP